MLKKPLFLLVVIILTLNCGSSEKKQYQNTSSVESTPKIEGNGSYSYYRFSYQKEGNKFAVVFSPVLPRDDATVIGSMLEVISTVYGKHKVTNLIPQLVERYGTNLIKFDGVDGDFYFLLVKEYTGEVSSLSLWTE